MDGIYISGSVTSDLGAQEYDFLVVKGERHIGLPQSDIDALGLKPSVFAFPRTGHASEGGAGKSAYTASVHFFGNSIELDALPATMPTVGVSVLRTLGFSVDLENGSIEEPATPLTIHRGLSQWSRPVGHNRVYAASDDGQVYALDAGNLEMEWRSNLLTGKTITHLTVANGRVYLALDNGQVYALDAGNLEMEWRSNLLTGKIITHLTVANGRVYLALDNGQVYALDAGNLEMLRKITPPDGRKIAHLAVYRD